MVRDIPHGYELVNVLNKCTITLSLHFISFLFFSTIFCFVFLSFIFIYLFVNCVDFFVSKYMYACMYECMYEFIYLLMYV